MKRRLRIFWARVRCNLYVLRKMWSDDAVCEATLYDDKHRVIFVVAVRSNFIRADIQPSGGVKITVNLAAIDRVFYQEEP